jgi:hypothetical protein
LIRRERTKVNIRRQLATGNLDNIRQTRGVLDPAMKIDIGDTGTGSDAKPEKPKDDSAKKPVGIRTGSSAANDPRDYRG